MHLALIVTSVALGLSHGQRCIPFNSNHPSLVSLSETREFPPMDLLLQAKLVLLSTEATNYWGSWTAVAGSPHATHTLQRMYGRSVFSRPSKAQLNIPKCRVRMQRSKAEPWKARLGAAKLRMLGSTLLCICGICSFRPPSCEGVKPDQPARHLSRGPSMLTGAY